MTIGKVILILCALVFAPANAQEVLGEPRLLDGFEDATPWRVVTSNQVSGELRVVDGTQGRALCLDYDFNGVSGYAGIQRDLPIDYPDNYAFAFEMRGDSPHNDLEMKFVDASGDNVWRVKRDAYRFPAQWTPVRYKKRHIDKAWGPSPDRVLRHSAKLEFVVANRVGGKGSVCFDALRMEQLAAADDSPLDATSTAPAGNASAAVDGDPRTAWETRDGGRLVLDLGSVREFGGLTLHWGERAQASRYAVQLSADGKTFRDVRQVTQGNGGTDWIALPESEARYVGIVVQGGPGQARRLQEARVEPLSYAATPNDFIRSVAAQSPRGLFPRGFSGEQPYWTIVGVDGGSDQGLIGEDGAVEVSRGGFRIEPFVLLGDRLVGWADVEASQSLQDGYLPIPSVAWKHPGFALRVTAFAHGNAGRAQLVARYRLENTTDRPQAYTLALAVRPLQVNPPSQFLSTVGGVSRIDSLSIGPRVIEVNGRPRLFARQPPDARFASSFDGGMAASLLDAGTRPGATVANDPEGLASGALLYEAMLEPGESREVDLLAPLIGGAPPSSDDWQAAAWQDETAREWRQKLDLVRIQVPQAGQALADTLRTATAHMLISRVGPRLQPGTRSYARSWIRDGAMISEGLLRMGRTDAVREYVDWYAPYQFRDGMVPCCVDDRGSDPVPENDSHGELIFNIAELYRYDGDKAFLGKMWPHVLAAFEYMEKLRLSERTEANRVRNPAFYGLMPVSISHEGYSAKPMHSYWDDFWALRGYKDAVEIAQALGKDDEARRMAASRDQFHADLQASLFAAVAQHDIDYLPGAAELGDFDPTSTTMALALDLGPVGAPGDWLHYAGLLHGTFERYWREFRQRETGQREWKDYTPYEWRNVSAFVRLGWRERAWDATQFFFKDRAPQAWNQWAEVVSSTPRKPFFVGDLPHAWVASDFVRSALDMFAYAREFDDSIELAAGIPIDWFQGKGVAIHGLRTSQGTLGYSLRRDGNQLRLDIDADTGLPTGGLVFSWPYSGKPGKATVNGEPVRWQGQESGFTPALRIHAVPAKLTIQVE
ncbi:discoidin domain-containing protein [Luteimonas mephitis]|uniref:discoidin domain-containing protein n=1 Tax=Luteimonas mephitis TaxID=83615 RepID=UPI003A910D83